MDADLKACSRCHRDKPLSEFRLLKAGNLTSHCKACAKEYLNAWRIKNASALQERRRLRYESRTDEERDARRASDRAAYGRNAENQRDKRLMSLFGIGLAEYNERLAAQDGQCAICGERCSSGRRLAVDHCHKTGAVRGLLCIRCNNGIGNFMDDPQRLLAAVAYLRKGAR
ncbi:MAG: endonuclease VII domain-containing protein [Rhodoglobus sp.]